MEIVYKNSWFSVILDDSVQDAEFYYTKHPDKVVILPYLYTSEGITLICLQEPIKIWNGKSKEMTAITGTIDSGETPHQTAIRELEEEAGLMLNYKPEDWSYLGAYNCDKGTQSKRHMFIVNVTDAKAKKKTTDGSWFEKNTRVILCKPDDISTSSDLALHFLLKNITLDY